jgi:hypothetical protein
LSPSSGSAPTLLDAVERALGDLARARSELDSMLVIGARVRAEGKLFKLRGNVPD